MGPSVLQLSFLSYDGATVGRDTVAFARRFLSAIFEVEYLAEVAMGGRLVRPFPSLTFSS